MRKEADNRFQQRNDKVTTWTISWHARSPVSELSVKRESPRELSRLYLRGYVFRHSPKFQGFLSRAETNCRAECKTVPLRAAVYVSIHRGSMRARLGLLADPG